MRYKQRGSGWSIQLVFTLYKILGYKFVYYLMYPVSLYYFIFASNVKLALKIYYENIGVEFNSAVYFNHLRIFAICMVDRFISKVDSKSYSYIYKDIHPVTELLSNGTILLYSHFGGWAASANSADTINKLNIVMQEITIKGIKKIEDSLGIKKNVNIIDLNQSALTSYVQIANALINNEIVAIMGDRALNAKSQIETTFFNKKANFNKSPFQIAYKTKKPILVFFIILMGIQKYKVEYIVIHTQSNLDEDVAIMKAVKEYVREYERIIVQYPNQWFNFYNFWKELD